MAGKTRAFQGIAARLRPKKVEPSEPRHMIDVGVQGPGTVTFHLATGQATASRNRLYYRVPDGDQIRLVAKPDPGARFAGWLVEGGTRPETTLYLTVHDAQMIGARFVLDREDETEPRPNRLSSPERQRKNSEYAKRLGRRY